MAISILVNGTERKNYIEWKSFRKEDIITSQVDTLRFTTKKYGDRLWSPGINDEVIVYDDADKIFGGVVIEIKEQISASNILTYDVSCKDYTHLLDRKLVFDTYKDLEVKDIIEDIISRYCDGFTTNNVETTGITLTYILFNYQEPSKCFTELADLIGYDWYVDYDKDIHFFNKRIGEPAPFNLTDTNGKYIFNSLERIEDDSQLRNVAYVRGGEYVGDERTDKIGVGDGETKTFKLPYRYDAEPVVEVNDAEKTVGIDYIDDEDDFDCLWNYQEKVIKFKTAPVDGHKIEITGKPLVPVLIKAKRGASIKTYGEYHHKIVDKTIITKEAARQRAEAEFINYAEPIKSAFFITTESGLRSGQMINIQSDKRNLDQNYVIIRIATTAKTATEGFIYKVELSTGRMTGIIDFLQRQIEDTNKKVGVFKQEGEVLDIIINLEDLDSIELVETLKINDPATILDLEDIDEIVLDETMIRIIKDSPPVWVWGGLFSNQR